MVKIFRLSNNSFFDWFEEAAENNFLAAKELQAFLDNFKNTQKTVDRIHDLEHLGDEICHKIFNELNSSFITPLDREDISSLTHSLDNIIDLTYSAINSIDIFGIKKSTPLAMDMSKIITKSTGIIRQTLPKFRKRKTFSEIEKSIIEINKLENEADELLRRAMKELFRSGKPAIEVVKLKSLYETMEEVIDACEDVGDVLRSLVTKYA
jgi:uncharacterized protein